jgi:hypothetical protein
MVEILFLCGTGKEAAVALIGGVNRGVSEPDNTKVLISYNLGDVLKLITCTNADNSIMELAAGNRCCFGRPFC